MNGPTATRSTISTRKASSSSRIDFTKPAGQQLVRSLAKRGFRRILIEGGATTVSRFLGDYCLDRLHVMIAPIILGAGPSSLTLPAVERIEQAVRAPMRAHVLDGDVLLDCDLRAQRLPIGRANMST